MNTETKIQPLVAIKTLTIKVGKKDIILSLEEAEALRNELNNHLGHNTPFFIPTWIHIPQPVYTPPQLPPPWYTTCQAQGLCANGSNIGKGIQTSGYCQQVQ